MRLVHQTGTVKVGEVVRYTITYTPSRDRVIPTPSALHVKIKNSSAIALRAAYLHGPYTLYAACYPAGFDPNVKQAQTEELGRPQFEPNLKAGGVWNAQLNIPENIRESTLSGEGPRSGSPGGSVTWVVEISSQVLFSTSATVHYELLVGRDQKSVEFGFAGMGGASGSVPGALNDHQQMQKQRRRSTQIKGVYSDAITLDVADTARIWSIPELPAAQKEQNDREKLRKNPVLADPKLQKVDDEDLQNQPEQTKGSHSHSDTRKKPHKQKIHLVLLTHGLHSNLGADMLYLKESIDSSAKQARLDRRMRRAKEKAAQSKVAEHTDTTQSVDTTTSDSKATLSEQKPEDDSSDDDEQTIVRGFPGNAVRTERGIQYLGKRLAKYVLAMTYPDQPYLPVKKKSMASSISQAFGGKPDRSSTDQSVGTSSHKGSTIHREESSSENLAYKVTSISFIGHSLGGLTQTYAVAYIQKHSPEFFNLIKPINFVALASPFLGLSNENPLYVKFALDFGLVGRTGQDLGLTWRAPTIARSGWGAMIAGMGTEAQKNRKQLNPGSKPLLRILPSGPAHVALKQFRNRTVYSNVVNDGIVPLRTSCLLFLDWRGLDRVEKARRENGIVGTMAGWGWAEITGQNVSDVQRQKHRIHSDLENWSNETSADERSNTPTRHGQGDQVPQPADNAVQEDNAMEPESPTSGNFRNAGKQVETEPDGTTKKRPRTNSASEQQSSPFAGFLSMLKPGANSSGSKTQNPPKTQNQPKASKIYRRSQTTLVGSKDDSTPTSPVSGQEGNSPTRPSPVRGGSVLQEHQVIAPPKTSVFEAAGDLLNPPLPDDDYINDPSKRPRTIFHDRVYHPEDIPSPPHKPRSFLRRASAHDVGSSQMSSSSVESASGVDSSDTSNMKVEEKIARAYHKDLAWRKVLVRLEPDAHNNIVVRRMFANAYGWPVIKHLVDTHFADTYVANTDDDREPDQERAKPLSHAVTEDGEEVKPPPKRAASADNPRISSEERDELTTLPGTDVSRHSSVRKPRLQREDSGQWDERFFASEDDDDDNDDYLETVRSPKLNLTLGIPTHGKKPSEDSNKSRSPTNLKTSPMILGDLTQSPSSATTHNVGLMKSLEQQIARGEEGKEKQEEGS